MTRRFVLVLLCCAATLAIIFTWPLAAQLSSGVAGRSVDAEQFLWAYWWFRRSLVVQHISPFWTPLLYYPEGVSLRYFTTNTLHALLAIPLQAIFGLVMTFNLIGLAIFVAACISMVWLAYDLSGSRAGALVAGVAFAFAPMQVFHWRVGQYNMLSVEFLPLYMLCLRRVLQADARRWRWVLAAAVALACAALCDWQFLIFLGLYSLLAVVAALLGDRRRWRSILGPALLVAALAAGVLLPYVLPMLGELSSDSYMLRSEDDTIIHAADVKAFVVPNPASRFWGDWATAQLAPLSDIGVVQTVVSVSLVTLALAAVGTLRRWRQARFWLITGGLFWLLSLGPRLKWFGTLTDIQLPYALLQQFKIVQVSRFPARYAMITQICLAVLAALGVAALLQRRDATKGLRWLRPAMVGIAGLALVAELLPMPRFVDPLAPAPSFFTDGTLAGAGAIVEQPNPSNRGMYFQTLHGHPVLWGELSRDNPAGPLLDYLRLGPSPRPREIFDSRSNWLCAAAALGITHYVHYGDAPTGAPTGTTLLRTEPDVSLYQLDDLDRNQTCIFLEQGWLAQGKLDDGTFYRWTGQVARVGLLRQAPGLAKLRLRIHCFDGPRHVQVRRDGAVLGEAPACGYPPQQLDVAIELPAGRTWIEIASVEPASNPADFGFSEQQLIAIGVSQLVVEQQ
jgi:hypothetical protein